jgi:hypothetical protein
MYIYATLFMQYKLSTLAILVIFCTQLFAQNEVDTISNKFLAGLYLEDLKITVPWTLPLTGTEKFGVKKIEDGRHGARLSYDSVTIFNNTRVLLNAYSHSGLFEKKSRYEISYFSALLDSMNCEKLKSFFISQLGNCSIVYRRKYTEYSWVEGDFFIFIIVGAQNPDLWNFRLSQLRPGLSRLLPKNGTIKGHARLPR